MTFRNSLPGIVLVMPMIVAVLSGCDLEGEMQRIEEEIRQGARLPTPEEIDLTRDRLECIANEVGFFCTMRKE